MNEEEMKREWREGGSEGMVMTENITGSIISGNHQTALSRLARRYRHFMIMGLICAFVIPAGLSLNSHLEIAVPIWFAVLMTVYFLSAALMDYFLWQKVLEINVFRMPTVEVIRKALDCRKLHFIFMSILFPIAIGILGLMVWFYVDNLYLVAGIISGFVVGLSIGLYQLSEFLKDYRNFLN